MTPGTVCPRCKSPADTNTLNFSGIPVALNTLQTGSYNDRHLTVVEETVTRMKMECVCSTLRQENYQSFPLKSLKTVNITSKLVKGFHTEVEQSVCGVFGLYNSVVMTLYKRTI